MGILSRLSALSRNDIGIDLGTTNTVAHGRGRGIVFAQPTIALVAGADRRVVAIGDGAKSLLKPCHTSENVRIVRPIQSGVIVDFKVAVAVLRHLIRRICGRFSLRAPRVLVAVPLGISDTAGHLVCESARQAGAGEVHLLDKSMAAAIGSGVRVREWSAHMVVSVGGGTVEIAVISMAGIPIWHSLGRGGEATDRGTLRSCGGIAMDQAITQYVKRAHDLLIGERTAEHIKIEIGSARKLDEPLTMDIAGRDRLRGLPRRTTIAAEEVREALQEPISRIVEAVHATYQRCLLNFSDDLEGNGIILTGGGALLRGLDRLISEKTGLPVLVGAEPRLAVANGAGIVLKELSVPTRAV